MKLDRAKRAHRVHGKYAGQYPEDIYVRLGDIWSNLNGEYRVTGKKYIMLADDEYDIEVDADPVQNTAQARHEESFALPELPNPTTDTYEYHLSIAVGDDYLDRHGKTWKVTGKYFREMSGGRLKIGFYLE